MKRWAVRTVRNGRVKVYGRYYAPDVPAKPEMEGKRFMFGLYFVGSPKKGIQATRRGRRFIYLWGTQREAENVQAWIDGEIDDHSIYTIDDGGLAWCWWNEIV